MKVTRKDGKIVEINLSEKEVEFLICKAISYELGTLPCLKGSTLSGGESLYFNEGEPQIVHETVEIVL